MQLPTETNKKEILSFIKQLKLNKNKKIVFKIDHPFWSFIQDNFNNPVIYDCMDDHESFEIGIPEFVDKEKELAKTSTLITVSSDSLKEKMKRYGAKQIVLLKNAGEYDHFSKSVGKNLSIPKDLKNLKGNIIGYYGAIAEWFDEKIVIKLAEEFPNDSIVLIGQVSHPTLRLITQRYKNCYLLGEKPYQKLPNYLQMFDVCLIPFVISDLIKATNPVKIYEYFAAGKPVVSTDLPELQEYKNIMYLSKSAEEFVDNVRKALIEEDKTFIQKRQKVAKNNTWTKRGEELNKNIISNWPASVISHYQVTTNY